MTRFLFVSLPLTGHLDWGGMLATAAVLSRRPHTRSPGRVARRSRPPSVERASNFSTCRTQAGMTYRTCRPASPGSRLPAAPAARLGLVAGSVGDPAAAAISMSSSPIGVRMPSSWNPMQPRQRWPRRPAHCQSSSAAGPRCQARRAHRTDASQPTHSLFMCPDRRGRALLGP